MRTRTFFALAVWAAIGFFFAPLTLRADDAESGTPPQTVNGEEKQHEEETDDLSAWKKEIEFSETRYSDIYRPEYTARVIRIIDGSSFKAKYVLTGKIETIRIIGIITPKLGKPDGGQEGNRSEVCAIEAKDALTELGAVLLLPNNDSGAPKRDRSGRLLRFAYFTEIKHSVVGNNYPSTQDVGIHLLEKGYARLDENSLPDDRILAYQRALANARSEKIGIWYDSAGKRLDRVAEERCLTPR